MGRVALMIKAGLELFEDFRCPVVRCCIRVESAKRKRDEQNRVESDLGAGLAFFAAHGRKEVWCINSR